MFFMNSVGVGLAIIMLVSSANNVGLDISDIGFGKSLIYKKKTKGQEQSLVALHILLLPTAQWVRLQKKLAKNLTFSGNIQFIYF